MNQTEFGKIIAPVPAAPRKLPPRLRAWRRFRSWQLAIVVIGGALDSSEKFRIELSRLLRAARKAGVKVFHCPAFSRADDLGSMSNTPLHSAIKKMGPRDFGPTSFGAANVPGLEPAEGEWVMWRSHAMTAFHDTSMDSLCRNMGIRTIVVTGVSLNCGVFGVTIEAINRSYRVIVPTDCVAGFPAEYGDMVVKHSLSGLSFLTTAKELTTAWGVNWSARMTSHENGLLIYAVRGKGFRDNVICYFHERVVIWTSIRSICWVPIASLEAFPTNGSRTCGATHLSISMRSRPDQASG